MVVAVPARASSLLFSEPRHAGMAADCFGCLKLKGKEEEEEEAVVVKGGGGLVPIDLKKLCYTLQWKECALRRRIFGVRPDSRALFFNSCIWTFTTVLFWCLLAFKNSVYRKNSTLRKQSPKFHYVRQKYCFSK